MRSLSLILSLVLYTTAHSTIVTSILVDKLQYNLPSLPTSANVWMNVKPTGATGAGVTWDVGTMTKANENQVFTLDEQTAPMYDVDWAALETIMTGESISITQTIDGTPVMAQVYYDWPFPEAPFPPEVRPELYSVKFKMQYFITERVRNQNQAYLAGIFEQTYLTPNDLVDYNYNSKVDAADYVVWRHGLGTTYTNDNYIGWRNNFGLSINLGTVVNANAIPEPCNITILLIALFILRSRKHGL